MNPLNLDAYVFESCVNSSERIDRCLVGSRLSHRCVNFILATLCIRKAMNPKTNLNLVNQRWALCIHGWYLESKNSKNARCVQKYKIKCSILCKIWHHHCLLLYCIQRYKIIFVPFLKILANARGTIFRNEQIKTAL